MERIDGPIGRLKISSSSVGSFTCKECQDTNWIIRVDLLGKKTAIRCHHCGPSLRERLISYGIQEEDIVSLRGLPDDLKVFPKYIEVADFLINHSTKWPNDSIYLYGSPGRGKTCLAIGYLAELDERFKGLSKRYMWVPELMTDFKRALNGNRETDEFYDSVQEPDVLVLDDFGTRHDLTDFGKEFMFHVIHKRIHKQTIITSNLSPDFLNMHYDQKTVSRLKRYKNIHVDGDVDLRGIMGHR